MVGDANLDETQAYITALSPAFDFIIDDGSHVSHDIVRSFARYFPKLTDGGVFVAEDLHCSYWSDFEGGVLHPTSSMAFFKRLADVINHEHWGTKAARNELFASFTREYGVAFDEESLAHIHSVEFVNSMCVIQKREPLCNVLGPRVVKGEVALVEEGIIHLDASTHVTPDQAGNAWSALDILPEDELMQLRRHSGEQHHELQALSERLQRKQAQVQALCERLQHEQAQVQALREALNERAAQVAQAQTENQSLLHATHQLREQLQRSDGQIQNMLASMSWKVSAPVRSLERLDKRISRVTHRISVVKKREGGSARLLRKCVKVLGQSGPSGVRRYLKQTEASVSATGTSAASVAIGADAVVIARALFDAQQREFTRDELSKRIDEFPHKPLISVVMPVYKTPVQWLTRAIESLQEQVYENWELCAVDDCSPGDEQRRVLERFARQDPRIRYHFAQRNGGISAASNLALEMARGEYVALVDHDDEITPDALYWMAKALNDEPAADFLYSDECKVDDTPARRLFDFVFKPDWSPEMLFNGMYTGHLTVYSKALVQQTGGFRQQFDFSQDYDLAFRAAERARHVVHVERLLYLWRSIPGSAAGGGKDYARLTNVAALQDFLARNDIPGTASALPHANCVQVAVPAGTKVSIVIPSDSFDNLKLAIDSILEKTSFPNYEVIAVCNSPLAEKLAQEYKHAPHIVFSCYDKKYNFSDKCNQGARDATGDIVIFYNDDVFPIEPDWIQKLIQYLYVPGVGGVSPKLLHKNQTIQYAGMISGTPGLCGTAYNGWPRNATDPFLSLHNYVRNVSILSGACCAFKKSLFLQVGGFDSANTPDGHSDMDLSYKVMAAGYRCVYTPHAVLFHIGHGSWNVKKAKYKADIFALKRWGQYVSHDPYFTDSMKRVLYRDFTFTYKIHASHIDPARSYTGPDVLFVSHELTLTGAPRMLYHAARAVLAQGGFPVVVAPEDGPMRHELIKAGIAVIIDASITCNHFLFGAFAKNFDTVVVNTMALDTVIRQLQRFENLHLIWWMHEAQALGTLFANLQGIDMERVNVLCVSEYAQRHVPAIYHSDVLYNGIPDQRASIVRSQRHEAFTFMISGTIEPRKGHDIFAEAIALLPLEMRRACRFVVVGKLWEPHRPFWESILDRLEDTSTLDYRGLLGHQDVLECIADSDVVVCCSRDESFSLSAIEAAMLEKPSILSSNVGVAQVFKREASCLVFESEDAAALAAKMQYAYEHAEEMRQIGKKARQIYERNFTIESFSKKFLGYLDVPADALATNTES